MHKVSLVIFFLLLSVYFNGQAARPLASYKLILGNSTVASKNYYLLGLLQQQTAVRTLIENDPVLSGILKKKFDQLSLSLNYCKDTIACFVENIVFSKNEISQVSERLTVLYTSTNALGILVKQHLVPSGAYVLLQNLLPGEMLAKAWEQDANGINFTINVYAAGKKPNYPNIDSISFNVTNMAYSRLLYNTLYTVLNECREEKLFFLPSLTAALHFLEINERDQAADYEPMEEGENKAAIYRSKVIKWGAYKYSLIMVPGAGPEEPAVALSAEGMLRCRLAAIQFKKGVAPFILTSGGRVHPYKTKYCEAVEMKKFLIEKLHVPANAILIDPHARHTTTNMRNAARLLYRYGFPFNKAAVTCTTRGQSSMIERTLIDRCMRELNEVPYKNGLRLSETEMEFYPLIECLQINPSEPMDP